MGLHHSGVEILGKEYSFASGGGIFDSSPKEAPGMCVFYKYFKLQNGFSLVYSGFNISHYIIICYRSKIQRSD